MKALEFKNPQNARYVFKGEDVYLLDRAKEVLSGFSPRYFHDAKISEIEEYARSLGMFGKSAAVISFSKDPNKEDAERLTALFKEPDETVILAAVNCKFLEKFAEVINCGKPSAGEARNFLLSLFEGAGFQAEPSAVADLTAAVNFDCGRIFFEADKLMNLFDASHVITREDVAFAVAADAEHGVFDLTNAISAGDNEKTLAVLAGLTRAGNAPAMLLSILSSSMRRMLLFSLAKEDAETLSAVYKVNAYAVDSARRNAKKFGVKKLKDICDMLYDAEYGIKSGKLAPEAALHEAVIHCLQKHN